MCTRVCRREIGDVKVMEKKQGRSGICWFDDHRSMAAHCELEWLASLLLGVCAKRYTCPYEISPSFCVETTTGRLYFHALVPTLSVVGLTMRVAIVTITVTVKRNSIRLMLAVSYHKTLCQPVTNKVRFIPEARRPPVYIFINTFYTACNSLLRTGTNLCPNHF